MRRFTVLLATFALLLFGLAPVAAAQVPSEAPCPTEGHTETVTVPSARNPRLDATQTTNVVVTSVSASEVHYVITVTTRDSYARTTTTDTYGAVCLRDDDDGGDPDPGDAELTEREQWIDALRWAHYDRIKARHSPRP